MLTKDFKNTPRAIVYPSLSGSGNKPLSIEANFCKMSKRVCRVCGDKKEENLFPKGKNRCHVCTNIYLKNYYRQKHPVAPIKNLPNEVWKESYKYPGYEISNLGRVKSKRRSGIVLINKKPSVTGYVNLILHIDGKKHYKLLHVLVAELFIPNPENKPQVNHKDGVKHHNWVDNLEWNTQSENMKHAYRTGLSPIPKGSSGKFGKDNKKSKLCGQYDLDGNLLNTFYGTKEASRITGIGQGNIAACCKGYIFFRGKRLNKHTAGGFIWKYLKDDKI